jgi:hypothetical protein
MNIKKILVAVSLMAVVLGMSACTTIQTTATVTPGAELGKVKTVYVAKFAKDGRKIDELIKSQLAERGFAVSALPDAADATLTYEDKWMWDILELRMNMTELSITLRDTKTNAPLVVATTIHGAAKRRSPGQMVYEVLTKIKSTASH